MAEGRNTRERLLEAAISIIEAEGEDGVRVDRVAEIAGFTKPVVYHHFADREDLVVAALAERYYRSINFAVDEIKFAAARCRTAAQFAEVLQKAINSFGSPEGIHRRRLRIEALGAAVSRPVLQASLIEANRRQAEAFGEILQIAEEEGWLRIDVNPVDLAAWSTALVFSRHLIEIDSENFDPEVWTQITNWTVGHMIGEPDGSQ
jgi:AcrR family transcriptional regulator